MGRVIRAQEGLPFLELLQHQIYDTKVLPPQGTNRIDFFSVPNSSRLMSNMRCMGQLAHPRRFHAFGLAITAYSVHPHINQKIIKATAMFDELRKLLFANAVIMFRVGSKDWLEAPISGEESFPQGSIGDSSDVIVTTQFAAPFDITMKEAIENPEKHRKLMKDYTLQVFIGNVSKDNFYHDITIERPNKKRYLRIIITDQPRRVNYFNLCVFVTGKNEPICIPAQQSFKAMIDWQEMVSYDPEFLGEVHVRVGLLGILARESM